MYCTVHTAYCIIPIYIQLNISLCQLYSYFLHYNLLEFFWLKQSDLLEYF